MGDARGVGKEGDGDDELQREESLVCVPVEPCMCIAIW